MTLIEGQDITIVERHERSAAHRLTGPGVRHEVARIVRVADGNVRGPLRLGQDRGGGPPVGDVSLVRVVHDAEPEIHHLLRPRAQDGAVGIGHGQRVEVVGVTVVVVRLRPQVLERRTVVVALHRKHRHIDRAQGIQHGNRIRAIADGIPDVPAAGEATAGPRIRQACLQRFDVAVDV